MNPAFPQPTGQTQTENLVSMDPETFVTGGGGLGTTILQAPIAKAEYVKNYFVNRDGKVKVKDEAGNETYEVLDTTKHKFRPGLEITVITPDNKLYRQFFSASLSAEAHLEFAPNATGKGLVSLKGDRLSTESDLGILVSSLKAAGWLPQDLNTFTNDADAALTGLVCGWGTQAKKGYNNTGASKAGKKLDPAIVVTSIGGRHPFDVIKGAYATLHAQQEQERAARGTQNAAPGAPAGMPPPMGQGAPMGMPAAPAGLPGALPAGLPSMPGMVPAAPAAPAGVPGLPPMPGAVPPAPAPAAPPQTSMVTVGLPIQLGPDVTNPYVAVSRVLQAYSNANNRVAVNLTKPEFMQIAFGNIPAGSIILGKPHTDALRDMTDSALWMGGVGGGMWASSDGNSIQFDPAIHKAY